MNVLLVGEESAGIQLLKALAQSDHRVVAVMASPTKKAVGGATLWQVAQQMGYLTWPAKLVKDPAFAAEIRAAEVDLLLNAHSLFVMHGEVVSAPRLGSFNMHPGPLPRYAGLNAVSWALYHGETRHGVTIHKMEPAIDTGPIVYQSLFDLTEDDTALSVFIKCMKEGVALMVRLLETAAKDEAAIPLRPQALARREYFGAGVPQQGRLIWSRPAPEIVNFVRACDFYPFPSPWGYPRATLNGRDINVVKARRTGQPCDAQPGTVGQSHGSGVYVAGEDEWIAINRLALEGRSVNPADALKPGDRLGDGQDI